MRLIFKILLILALSIVLFVFGMNYSNFILILALLVYLEVKLSSIKKILERYSKDNERFK